MPLASDQGIRPGKLHPFAAEHKDRMRAGAQNRKRVAATISFSSPISGQAIVNRVVIHAESRPSFRSGVNARIEVVLVGVGRDVNARHV